MKGAGRSTPPGRSPASKPAEHGSSGNLRQMVDASPSPRSRSSTPRADTKSSAQDPSASASRWLLSALRDQDTSNELQHAQATNSSSMAAQDRRQGVYDQHSQQQATYMPQDAAAPTADTPLAQPLDADSAAEEPIDPDVALARALDCITDWHTGIVQEVEALPKGNPDDPLNRGMWRWLTNLFGDSPAGPFSLRKQEALVTGHAHLIQRMRQLQTLLLNLHTSVDTHAAKLQQVMAQLEAAKAGKALLRDEYKECIRTESDNHVKLLLLNKKLKDVQEKADELNVEAHGMRARLAAGDNQINALVAEIALLERLNQEAATSRLLELEALTTTCKKMEAQNARYNTEDMEAERDTYRSLHTTQGQELQEAVQQLAAARQQGREAVMAAEARAAAEKAPLAAGVLELQRQLSANQLELDRVTAQLEETNAKFWALMQKVTQAGKDKEKAAAALAAATTTYITLQQEKLQLESSIKDLQVEKEDVMASTAKAVEELEAVNQRVSQVAKEMATKEAERAQLAAEVEALNKNIRGLEKDYASKERELATAEGAKAKAEADLKEAEKELQELQQVLNQKSEVGAKLQKVLGALKVQYKACEKEEKAYQAAMVVLTKLEGMERELEVEEAAYLQRAPLVEAAKQREVEAHKAYKETAKKVTAVDKAINDLKALMQREAEAAAAKKAIMLAAQEAQMQRIKEKEDKTAALQADLDVLDSKTVAGIKGDINTLYAKLDKAADEEEKVQQERNRLQTEVNKASHVLAAKEEVVLGKKATLQAMDEELLQLKAGTAAVALQAQTEANRAAQLTGNVGRLKAAATSLAGVIREHKQVRTDLLGACSAYEQLLGSAAANAAGDADVEQP